MAARRAHNPKVAGSSPAPATIIHGSVAQSVEQRTENPRVGGSIPSRATFLYIWRHSQVVRPRSAKPSFPGSNPGGAFKKSFRIAVYRHFSEVSFLFLSTLVSHSENRTNLRFVSCTLQFDSGVRPQRERWQEEKWQNAKQNGVRKLGGLSSGKNVMAAWR